MESALGGMSQASMDLGVFKETKLTGGVYIRSSVRYSIVAMDTPIRHCVGVALFHWLSPQYTLEAIQQFGPYAVGFQLATGELRLYIIGCYLAPDNTLTINSVVAALKERPQGLEILVIGDLNVNLKDPEGYQREEDIVAALTAMGLEYMMAQFLPQWCPWCQDGRTWSMVQLGREVQSRMYCILGIYRCLFRNVVIWDPQHNSDHYLVIGCLCSAPLR